MNGMMKLWQAGLLFAAIGMAQGNRGYYRMPEIGPQGLLFVAEGDLWSVPLAGGMARRLTTHPAEEVGPRISPDGKTIAFTANYEGLAEVYTMPSEGGLPKRRSFGGGTVVGWTPDGKILFRTSQYNGLPSPQLATLADDNTITLIPLSQAYEGSYSADGKTLFFARRPPNFSLAKRYQGGLAQTLWKFTMGMEAVPLSADYPGTSERPMVWEGRVYFQSDRGGSMNLWSMDQAGKNLKQHTRHSGFDVRQANLREGKIVYQMGSDIYLYDIASGADRRVEIQLNSDFDHLRERWVKKPFEYLSSYSLSHDGEQLTLVARGRTFVAPAQQGRFVAATSAKARYREAHVIPGTKELLVLSSESGELEWWRVPANGTGGGERLTTDGKVMRWSAAVSPNGKLAIHSDKDNQLWILNLESKENKLITRTEFPASNSFAAFRGYRWSPDSRYVLYETPAKNDFVQLWLYGVEDSSLRALTTDRYNSGDAAWSEDGKWIYMISDRALRSTVFAPWGARAPDPHFDRSDKIYEFALRKGLRSPFEAKTEIDVKAEEKKDGAVKVEIDFEGLSTRIAEVPVPAGNYSALSVAGKRLCYLASGAGEANGPALRCLEIANKGEKPETLLEGVSAFRVSGNGKKMLVRKGNEFYVADASAKSLSGKPLADARVDLTDWAFSVIPQEEFREAFVDAWRLHRDYFYDRNMHGVNWKLMKDKYGEYLTRVRDRAELNDLIGQMVSELNVMHTSVNGGDLREAPDQIRIGRLGAELARENDGAWKIERIYQHDPDRPDFSSPLARRGVEAKPGDRLLAINGVALQGVTHPYELLKNQEGKQVLVRLESGGVARDVIVRPQGAQADTNLRYHEWEYTRRLETDRLSKGRFGYVHLRAMGPNDIAQWAEHYFPVFDREALIVDVRHNNGGNIDSWILSKLLKKAWMYWQPRVGKTSWNMHYAFRGPMVVLVNERTASDGEAFAEGFRRLGLGKVIGTRTWGGEVWLSSSNRLADDGIATAAELGVFGPNNRNDQEWLVEGVGVIPDIVVDNLPHATFAGKDAQLEAAVRHLEEEVKKKAIAVPKAPAYPDKSLK